MVPSPAAQAHLDNEIAMILALCNLRTQRNTFSSISRLPPEILAYIFIHYARIYRQMKFPSHGVPDWVKVSYVCRHWRAVALNCPTLWTFLFVSSHNWTNTLLARSKAAPLTVLVDSSSSKLPKELYLLEKVASQAYRIQDLCLSLTCQEAERVLSLFPSRAPLLQTLRISVIRPRHLREPLVPVAGTLLDGDTPALRKLELTQYATPLTSPALYGLTSLRLRNLSASESPRPTLGELKVALSHMQDLAHLHLENALPSALVDSADWAFDDSEKLSFPQLSRLSIIAPSSTVTLLLSCFDLPLKTEVRLRCCFESRDDHTRIYPHLAKRFTACEDQALGVVPIIRTCLINAESSSVSFVFSATESDFGLCAFSADSIPYHCNPIELQEDWDCNIPLKVDVAVQSFPRSNDKDIIGGLCRSLPLTNLQSAQIGVLGGTILSSAFWTTTFGHLEELRHLKLTQVDLKSFMQALFISPCHSPPKNDDGNVEPHSDQIFAPAMEKLEFYRVEFDHTCYGKWQGRCYRCAGCLCDALSDRQVDGCNSLQRLILGCSFVSDKNVMRIRKLGTDVDWYGPGEIRMRRRR